MLAAYLQVDDTSDTLLFALVQALLDPAVELSLVAHGDGVSTTSWQALTDPLVAPLNELPYTAQWMGAVMPDRLAGESDDSYTARARAALIRPLGMRRGSAEALTHVALAYLTGAQVCKIVQNAGGNPWQVAVGVFDDQVTDFDGLTAALNDNRVVIAGQLVVVEALSDITWLVNEFEDLFRLDDVATFEADADFATVHDFETFEVD